MFREKQMWMAFLRFWYILAEGIAHLKKREKERERRVNKIFLYKGKNKEGGGGEGNNKSNIGQVLQFNIGGGGERSGCFPLDQQFDFVKTKWKLGEYVINAWRIFWSPAVKLQ